MFPHINTKATNIEINRKLANYLEKRLRTLERLISKGETDLVCDVELERVTRHHQSGKIFRAEINLRIAGKLFRAEATEDKIEDAIDHAKNELKRELRRSRDKKQSLFKRGSRKAKDILRFGR